ncbi:MAG: site-specific integrase [Pseudomonadota bacterium]
MNPAREPPAPIVDNLAYISNPFKQREFSAKAFIGAMELAGSDRDLEYALKFLYSYNGSTATFNSYRREIERLLQWSWRIERSAAIKLRREHIEEFVRFCIDPPLAWIGTKNVARFKDKDGQRIPSDDWRPFVASVSKSEYKGGAKPNTRHFFPSQAAIKATFTALSSFYKYLVQEDLIEANPVSLIRQKSKFVRKDHLRPAVRRISNLQWDYVVETAEMMADESPEKHERTLFIMNCLFAMYLRISELVADERSRPVMGDFRRDHDGHWWFHVTGKGNKNRTITVCDAMLVALKRYRKSLGLPLLPTPGEQIPLISKKRGKGPMTSSRNIRNIVQACFDVSHERMCQEGLEEDAGELKAATVHWLRHTGISEDVKFRPREHVRDDAGHASMATTDRYIESDMRERHLSGKKKRIKDI